ncbi:MAG: (Fe-S)-binding protein [Candidatus Thiodiazotropha sp.]
MTPEELLTEADRCVKCGLCLPECPTYRLLANEADSPRGRISLMQALVAGELDLDSGIEIHLDRCLGCRSCESACPSGVRYGQLLDASRDLIAKRKPGKAGLRWLLTQMTERRRLQTFSQIYRPFRHGMIARWASKLLPEGYQRLPRLGRQLSDTPAVCVGFYPARQPKGRLVQLFTGCVANQLDQALIETGLTLLRGLGYAVEIPETQHCCGALHRHNGAQEQAEGYCEANRQQTAKSQAQALITLASACELELNEQQASKIPVVNMTDLLLSLMESEIPPLKPYMGRVAVHLPCSCRDDGGMALLKNIPQAEIFPLAENSHCCGAAGSYLFTQPLLSKQLGETKIEHLQACEADILITSNTGCALQFRELIDEAGLEIQVMHPIELIHLQWPD